MSINQSETQNQNRTSIFGLTHEEFIRAQFCMFYISFLNIISTFITAACTDMSINFIIETLVVNFCIFLYVIDLNNKIKQETPNEQEEMKQDEEKQDETKQGEIEQSETKQDETKQDKTNKHYISRIKFYPLTNNKEDYEIYNEDD